MAGQSQKKLDNLLKKSEELFFKYGYNSVSVDQIAKEAGISKMTIYKHFHSKENLFIEVMIKVSEVHYKLIMERIDEKYHTMDKFESLYKYMLEVASIFPPILTKDVLEHASIFERIKNYKLEMSLSLWRTILEDGIKKKEIRPLDVDFVSKLLLYLPMNFVDKEHYGSEIALKKFMENLFDFIKYGMLGGMEDIKNGEKHTHEDSERK